MKLKAFIYLSPTVFGPINEFVNFERFLTEVSFNLNNCFHFSPVSLLLPNVDVDVLHALFQIE